MRNSLLVRLFMACILFSLVPILIVLSIFNYNILAYSENEISRSNIEKLNLINNTMIQMSDQFARDALRISSDTQLNKLYGIDNYFSNERNFNEITVLSQALNIFTEETRTNDRLESVYLYLDNSDYVLTSDSGILSKTEFIDTEWIAPYKKSMEVNSPLYWINRKIRDGSNVSDTGINNGVQVITYMFPLTPYTTNLRGEIVFNIKENEISSLLNDKSDSRNGYIIITDQNGNIVSHINKTDIGTNISQNDYMKTILDSAEDTGYVVIETAAGRELITYLKSDFNGYIYIGIHSMNSLMSSSNSLRNRIFGIALAVIVFTIFISVIVVRRIYSPMRKLIQQIKSQKGLEVKKGETEMMIISKAFNESAQQEKKMFDIMETSKRTIRDSALHNLLNGNQNDEAEEELADFNLEKFFCIAVAIDDNCSFRKKYTEKEDFYMKTIIMKICEGILNDRFHCAGVLDKDGIAIIINIDETDMVDLNHIVPALLEMISNEIAKVMDNSVSFAVGNVYNGKLQVKKSYFEALNALRYRLVKGPKMIVWWKEIEQQRIEYYYPNGLEKYIINALNQNSKDKIYSSVSDIVEDIRCRKGLSYENIIQIFYQLIGCTVKYLSDANISITEIYVNILDIYNKIETEETLDGIKQLLINMYLQIIDYRDQQNLSQYDYVTAIFNFIQKNLHKEIDIETIAEHLGISYSYARKVFQEKTGKSILSYIHEIRIEEAKKLLSGTDMSIKDIALKLGYNNDKTFTRCFKKIEAMTPGEFRNKIIL